MRTVSNPFRDVDQHSIVIPSGHGCWMLPSWRFAALGPLLVPEWVHQHEYPGFLSILQYSSHSLLAYSRSRWSLYTLLTPVSYVSVGYDRLGYIPLFAGGRLTCFTLAVSSFTYWTAWALCWSWVGAAGEGACYLWLPGVKTRAKQIGRRHGTLEYSGTTSVPVK